MFKGEPRQAQIIREKGKLMLKAGRETVEIPEGIVSKKDTRELVGKRVELIYAEPKRAIIGLRVARKPPILCYVPVEQIRPTCYIVATDLDTLGLKDILTAARRDMVDQLYKAGMIQKVDYAKIIRKPLCYIPAPEFMERVSVDVRRMMAKQMLEQDVISKEVYAKLI